MSRVRFRYSKLGKVRFLSHRDVARVLERAVRRAGLPVAYSQGFSPRARLHFGLALSTGFESHAEYVDVDLLDADLHDEDGDGLAVPAWELDELPGRMSACTPEGIEVQAAVLIPPGTPSLQDAVNWCTWRFDVPGVAPGSLAAAVERLGSMESIPVDLVRKGKQVREDLRPLLGELVAERTADGARVVADLGTKPRSIRPAEFYAALDSPEPLPDVTDVRVLRLHQWINVDGARCEPVSLGAPSTHAQERAS